MSESQFAKGALDLLALHGRKVLRVSDGTDGRHGQYGLRALVSDEWSRKTTGADYLVLPRDGMRCVVVRDISQVRFLAPGKEAFFMECKDPFAKRRTQVEQNRWLQWVAGEKL